MSRNVIFLSESIRLKFYERLQQVWTVRKMPSQRAKGSNPMKPGLAYTIPRRREEKPPNTSPGPAGYDVIKLSVYKSAAPGYSIGGRTKEMPKKVVSPGPKYLPKLPTVGPKGYSFGIRTTAGPYIIPEDR